MYHLLFFPFILVLLELPVRVNLSSCGCQDAKNFLILLDNLLEREDLFECQSFAALLSPSLLTSAPNNKVAFGTFSVLSANFLKEPSKQSCNALELNILDTSMTFSNIFRLKEALEITRTTIKESNSTKKFVALFVIVNKYPTDKENTEIEASAKLLYSEFPSFVGFTIGIGTNVHEGTLSALSGGNKKRMWRINSVFELENIEGIVHIRMTCDSTHTDPNTIRLKMRFYEHIYFQGESIELDPRDVQRCFTFSSVWNDKISSINSGSECIDVFEHTMCRGDSRRMYPGTPHHDNLIELGFNDKISSVQTCNGGSTHTDPNTISVALFSESFYKGQQLTLQLGPKDCLNFKDYPMGSKTTSWETLVRSVKTSNKCIYLYYSTDCSGGWYPSLEYDSGIDEFQLTSFRKDTRSIRQCPPRQGLKPKLGYISLYKERNFAGRNWQNLEVSKIGSCYTLPKDVADPWLGSIRAHGNCIELYNGEQCKEKILMRKVDSDLPDVQQIIHPQSLRLCT